MRSCLENQPTSPHPGGLRAFKLDITRISSKGEKTSTEVSQNTQAESASAGGGARTCQGKQVNLTPTLEILLIPRRPPYPQSTC